MRYVRWVLWAMLFVFVLAFFHYTLPQRDIMRVVKAEPRRIDFGVNSVFWNFAGSGDAVNLTNRDVFFIEAVDPDGDVMVYRNQDTGWGWPPYFKFDSATLSAEASNAVSTKEDPQWYAIKHYGWRNELISIFPNAVSIKPVEGPDVTLIPWTNIVIILVLIAVFRAVQVRVRRIWRRIRGLENPANP